MIFSEIYGAYYNAVTDILRTAVSEAVTDDELRRIIGEHAFGESIMTIEPKLRDGRWKLLRPDGTTPLKHVPEMPLTTVQKRWLKAISMDPRIRLFQDEVFDYPDVEPLFTPDMIRIFDKYGDGDDFTDENYIRIFRKLRDAIKEGYPVCIEMNSGRDKRITMIMQPAYLEYSEKDDKFRVYGTAKNFKGVINLGRIKKCTRYEKDLGSIKLREIKKDEQRVVFELRDERNALERVMLHFAHFKKEAVKLDEKHYRVSLFYEKDDETELVIRILSFGPMIKVVEPDSFVNLIKRRLMRQKGCGL